MKAVVIGASGHIGNAIVRALVKRNYQVSACGRRIAPPVNLAGLPVQYKAGDAGQPGQFDKWIAGHDIVIDAAAPYPLQAYSAISEAGRDPIFDSERRTRWLIDAVSKHEAQLAYVSSFVTLVRPRTAAQRIKAQAMRIAHPYFNVKEAIEAQILDARHRGVRSVIVNPTYCLGPWDLHDRQICTIPLLLSGEIPASISQMLNVIDVRDVALALLAAIDAQRYSEPILLSGHSISTHDLYSLICELGGVPRPRISVSTGLALAGAYWTELILGTIGQKAALPSGGMMMATSFDYLIRGKEMLELGITPRPLIETVADAIRWYREIGYC